MAPEKQVEIRLTVLEVQLAELRKEYESTRARLWWGIGAVATASLGMLGDIAANMIGW